MLGDNDSSSTSSSRNSETVSTPAAADSSGTATSAVSDSTTETAANDMQDTVNTDATATDSTTGNDREGLVPRAMRLLFDTLAAAAARDPTAKMSYTVHASYLQASQTAV
jgi:hypothetical protein